MIEAIDNKLAVLFNIPLKYLCKFSGRSNYWWAKVSLIIYAMLAALRVQHTKPMWLGWFIVVIAICTLIWYGRHLDNSDKYSVKETIPSPLVGPHIRCFWMWLAIMDMLFVIVYFSTHKILPGLSNLDMTFITITAYFEINHHPPGKKLSERVRELVSSFSRVPIRVSER